MSIDPQILIAGVSAVVTAGVAWGAAQTGAKSTTREVRDLVRRFTAHEAADHEREVRHVERLATVEALVKEVHKAVTK